MARRRARQNRMVMTGITNDEEDRKTTARRPREQERSAEDDEKKANSCLSSGDESENEVQTREWGKTWLLVQGN